MASTKITKGAIAEYVRHQLLTNDVWAKAALLKIYARQTADEQNMESTRYLNGIGFGGADAEIMSSFAKQLISRGFLSPKQMTITHKKMAKYTRQIIELSDPTMLSMQVARFRAAKK